MSSKYIGMMMGLGKRSPFTSSLEDSGKIAEYSTKYLDLTKL